MPNDEPESDLAKRIRQRLEVLQLSAAAASIQAFGNDGTIRNILIGKSKNPRFDTMMKLAQVLETSVEWLSDKSDTRQEVQPDPFFLRPIPKREDSSRPTPVYASVEGGEGALIISNEPIDYAPRPQIVTDEDDLYGVVVEGTSMGRAYRPGDTVWLHPRYRERRDEPCVFRAFDERTGDARATIKWLIDFDSEEWTVEQFDPPKIFKLSRRDWPECYKVLGKKNRP